MAEVTQRPGLLNIIYTQGDDLPLRIKLGFNLTGFTLIPVLEEQAFEGETEIPFKIIDISTGLIELTFPRATFGQLPESERPWALFVYNLKNQKRKFLAGLFKIVTR